jgi:hypothetical protein
LLVAEFGALVEAKQTRELLLDSAEPARELVCIRGATMARAAG